MVWFPPCIPVSSRGSSVSLSVFGVCWLFGDGITEVVCEGDSSVVSMMWFRGAIPMGRVFVVVFSVCLLCVLPLVSVIACCHCVMR